MLQFSVEVLLSISLYKNKESIEDISPKGLFWYYGSP